MAMHLPLSADSSSLWQKDDKHLGPIVDESVDTVACLISSLRRYVPSAIQNSELELESVALTISWRSHHIHDRREIGICTISRWDRDVPNWYKVVGELGAGRRPIVCLHGGAGMTHHYMLYVLRRIIIRSEAHLRPSLSLVDHIPRSTRALGENSDLIICRTPDVGLASAFRRFYDQLGNGESTHLPDAPKDFWKPDLWVDELNNLLLHLGISDGFDLLGNSWGGMLAAHFATTQTTPGLKSLIVSNSPASIPLLKEGTEALIDRYPDAAAKMRKHAEGELSPTQNIGRLRNPSTLNISAEPILYLKIS
ncbi:Alpha/Beta hydrolase protein [Salix suchowensis]|nr:Alpha/Beta hydrolase protein [Salix suchowensis]